MTIGLGEALGLIATLPRPEPVVDNVPVALAAGRVLTAPAVIGWPMPRFDCAAVDGWALRASGRPQASPLRLPIRGRVTAGEDATDRRVGDGAIRIFTGAMLPPDADAVVMQEQASVAEGCVLVPGVPRIGQHVRRRGEQAAAGMVLLPGGHRLRAQDLAALAAGGLTSVTVAARLRVGVLSTGNEVRPIGTALEPGTIPDQNNAMVAAMVVRCGATPVAFGPVGDDRSAITEQLRRMAVACDIVLTTGGVSVGEEDHLRGAIEALGRILFWRVAMKPGRPTALGVVGTTPVLALPGNPAAAFTAFHLVGEPLLRHRSGELGPARGRSVARAGFEHHTPAGVTEPVPVRLLVRDGALWAEKAGADRGGLASLVAADALALAEQGRDAIAIGDSVPVIILTA